VQIVREVNKMRRQWMTFCLLGGRPSESGEPDSPIKSGWSALAGEAEPTVPCLPTLGRYLGTCKSHQRAHLTCESNFDDP
jgi:hypothetical protein